ncbi:hypothetical protein [Olivibacter domesticus]|uniref:Uncharacterized protein n=1 Tax=Olivibacter domesticus TaxID=407022 RepID=A0A1H7YXU8_OLID1|nr:hypothetical protein [Olivibacter domesticus]SEM50218.1 hypothetical protein SAMN05661044_05354 [Olivibacter domesticus]
MKGLRIKQKAGKSFIELDPLNDDHVRKNHLLTSISEWSGEGEKSCNIYLNVEQTKELFEYLRRYLDEKNEVLALHREGVIEQKKILKSVYQETKNSGKVTYQHLTDLSKIGAPIIALLAKDFHVPASEVLFIAKNNPLPFALLNKHYKVCWESVLTEPIPINILV